MGKMYVVGEVSFDYNDEYYFPAGDDGAVVPQRVFTDEGEAKQWCVQRTIDAINNSDYRTGSDLAYDATYHARWQWHFETAVERCPEYDPEEGECCGACDDDVPGYIEPGTTYDEEFDYKALIAWSVKTDADLWDYLPRLFDIFPVEVGA